MHRYRPTLPLTGLCRLGFGVSSAALLACSDAGTNPLANPVIDYINPSQVTTDDYRVYPYVYGAGFAATATALVNGATRPINWLDAGALQVILSDQDLAQTGI